jgi:membrane protein implicated in regulation of membrane protease activity
MLLLLELLLLLPLSLLVVGEALPLRVGLGESLLFWVHGAFVLAFVLALAVAMERRREEVDDEAEDGRTMDMGFGHWRVFDG